MNVWWSILEPVIVKYQLFFKSAPLSVFPVNFLFVTHSATKCASAFNSVINHLDPRPFHLASTFFDLYVFFLIWNILSQISMKLLPIFLAYNHLIISPLPKHTRYCTYKYFDEHKNIYFLKTTFVLYYCRESREMSEKSKPMNIHVCNLWEI